MMPNHIAASRNKATAAYHTGSANAMYTHTPAQIRQLNAEQNSIIFVNFPNILLLVDELTSKHFDELFVVLQLTG